MTVLATAAANVALLNSTAQHQQQQQQPGPDTADADADSTDANATARDADNSNSNGGSTATGGRATSASEQLLAELQSQPATQWAAAGAAVVSALLPPEDLPAVSSLCFLAFVWATMQEVGVKRLCMELCMEWRNGSEVGLQRRSPFDQLNTGSCKCWSYLVCVLV